MTHYFSRSIMRPGNRNYNFAIYGPSGSTVATLIITSLDSPGMLLFEPDVDSEALLQFIGIPTASVPVAGIQRLLGACEVRR